MRIATVNVNGVRAALRKGMQGWLDSTAADVVCLQEVRAPDEVVDGAFDGWHLARVACRDQGPRRRGDHVARTELTDVLADADALGEVASAPEHTGRWLEATVPSTRRPGAGGLRVRAFG